MTTIKCGRGRQVFRTALSEQDTPINLVDFTEFAVEKLKAVYVEVIGREVKEGKDNV